MKAAAILAVLFASTAYAGPVADARAKWHGAPEPVAAISRHQSYPTAHRRANWSYPGNIRQHVLSGEHRGKLDPAWVAAQSDASLRAWHSDDHEGRVRWEYVVRPSASSSPPQAQPRAAVYCPSGNCPTSRPGLFQGWFRR